MKIAEQSERVYRVSTLDDLENLEVEKIAAALWPGLRDSPVFPRILSGEDGSISITAYELGEECTELLEKAEPLFKEREFKKALKYYRKAANKYPDCYLALSHLGDCFYLTGEAEKALEWYDKAVSLNPHDFRLHLHRGNALHAMEQYCEARQAYIQALALRPHRESVIGALTSRAADLGVEIHDESFQPRALAREEEDSVAVYADTDVPCWFAYGMCKGIWIGEEGHRAERTGNSEHNWTSTEEQQCLLATLDSYLTLKEGGLVELDPQMERVYSAAQEGVLSGFLFYEIGYRIYPHITLLMPQGSVDQIVRYIDLYVIPTVSTSEDSEEAH